MLGLCRRMLGLCRRMLGLCRRMLGLCRWTPEAAEGDAAGMREREAAARRDAARWGKSMGDPSPRVAGVEGDPSSPAAAAVGSVRASDL
eukprot:gene22062-22587_t